MRVTLDIQDELHARLNSRAKAESTTMRAIILRAIDAELKTEAPAPTSRRRFPTIPSTRKDKLVIDNETTYDLIDFP
jgi:hypothetical protein